MTRIVNIILLIIIFALALSTKLKAESPVLRISKPDSTYYNVGKSLSYFIDSTHSFTLEDLQQLNGLFQPVKRDVPSFGLEDNTIWLRFQLTQDMETWPSYVVQLAFPTIDSITYFQQLADSTIISFQGDQIPFNERQYDHKHFNFLIADPEENQENLIFYLKIRNAGTKLLPIHLIPENKLFAVDFTEELLYGIFYGILLVMMLYNLFLAFSARNKSYLYYVGIILGNILTLSAVNGHAFQYVWMDTPWWANHVIIFGIGLWISSGNLFARKFLETYKHDRWIDVLLKFTLSVGLLILISTFLFSYKTIISFTNYALLFNCLVLLGSGVVLWANKVPVAPIFTLSWFAYLVGVSLYTLRNLAILPVNFITTHTLEIGAIAEVVLLAIALGHKYRLLELEKDEAKNHALDLMTHSSELIKKQNEQLEDTVEERTRELHQKQEEILTQNEELNAKNEKLMDAQRIIEEQNIKLRNYNENLESEVAKRTNDLKSTNQQLAQNVQKLEQYAFMTAHNLRSPVARVLGLTHLLELEPTDQLDENTKEVVKKIKEEGDNLDSVIKDLNSVIELRNESDPFLEEVDLRKVHSQILRILKNSIEINKAEIKLDLSAFSSLLVNPTFIESIWYNLISNALKYRSNAAPLVSIKTEEKGDSRLIYFQDNGIGIDVDRYGVDIFKMYSRLNREVAGKGMGLFLVKSQMEMMGAEVILNSKPKEGSTFILKFKNK